MFDLEQKLAGVGATGVSQSDMLRALLVSSAKVTNGQCLLICNVDTELFNRILCSVCLRGDQLDLWHW